MMKLRSLALILAASTLQLTAAEFHVSTGGNDANPGTKKLPLRTIQRAADLAQPGDVITVHEGIYREHVNPPRGGASDKKRIVYQAARGEQVVIKGSEPVKNWVKVQDNAWKATVPNSRFGEFNPYADEIRGDWFNGKGRAHHTGAVYLNGDWLIEAAKLEEVLAPLDTRPAWLSQTAEQYLLNVAWLQPAGNSAARIPAANFAAQEGIQKAPCSEGGECIGFIEHNEWVRYQRMDFGTGTEQVEFRVASASEGGIIEVRLDSPEGELLGTCRVPNTSGWQSWTLGKAKIKPVSGVRTVCLVFKAYRVAAVAAPLDARLWFAQVDANETTIWAQFEGVNPNEQDVEINVRRAVFFPEQPGRNYITVRGFTMQHAATPWAPPTAGQVGLIGTHWSKGWVIENNVVSHSVCSGIALGKYGDEFDNTSANTAEGYVKTIERALANGWHRDNIGHHVVRNNTISHCEQAGIVGSLGAAFCTVTGNTIHDIHVRRLFTGAEMAGIKFHAAIDTVLSNNHIYRTCLGLWLDWMAQGTRVSANLFHDNGRDLFVEVNHGPFVVDNNLFLSAENLLDMSQGGAYAHNWFNGRLVSAPELRRETPYHPAHSTVVAGLTNIHGGDCRFYNNIFVGPANAASEAAGFGLAVYDKRPFTLHTGGNVYLNNAKPYAFESESLKVGTDPKVNLQATCCQTALEFEAAPELKQAVAQPVTTKLLGQALIPGLPYVNADGSALKINTDFFGKKRSGRKPLAGPFEKPGTGRVTLKLR